MTPFTVLNVTPTSTDAEVRASYQTLLRQHTPEQDPANFQLIQTAYDQLRTQRDRWRSFALAHPWPGQSLAETTFKFANFPGKKRPPGAKPFRSFLTNCLEAAARPKQ